MTDKQRIADREYENDQLQAENERLRNALIDIRDGQYADAVQCESIADEALSAPPQGG